MYEVLVGRWPGVLLVLWVVVHSLAQGKGASSSCGISIDDLQGLPQLLRVVLLLKALIVAGLELLGGYCSVHGLNYIMSSSSIPCRGAIGMIP